MGRGIHTHIYSTQYSRSLGICCNRWFTSIYGSYIRTHIWVGVYIYTHTHAHTHMYTHAHTYTHTYIYICILCNNIISVYYSPTCPAPFRFTSCTAASGAASSTPRARCWWSTAWPRSSDAGDSSCTCDRKRPRINGKRVDNEGGCFTPIAGWFF